MGNHQEPISESTVPADAVGHTVVTAVAQAEGVSPLELTPPLARAIDPDALESIVASLPDRPGLETPRVQFRYCGYTVTVTGDGEVSLSQPARLEA